MTPTTFRPSPTYVAVAGAAALFSTIFAATAAQGLRAGGTVPLTDLFFCAVALLIGVWALRWLLSKVHLGINHIALQAPLTGTNVIEFRQLSSVSRGGRLGSTITVLYHPLRENGTVELDEVRSLILPSVRDQAALFAALEEHVPS